jgi:hypothetical protein
MGKCIQEKGLRAMVEQQWSYRLRDSSHDFSNVRLARSQRDQSLIAGVGDGDNSLSIRWGKSGARSSMNLAAGAGTGLH